MTFTTPVRISTAAALCLASLTGLVITRALQTPKPLVPGALAYNTPAPKASTEPFSSKPNESWERDTPIFAATYTEGGHSMAVLVVRHDESGNDCNACRAELAAFVFQRTGNSWRIEKTARHTTAIPVVWQPHLRLVRTGPDKHAVLIEGITMAQGVWGYWQILGLSEPVIRVLLNDRDGAGGNGGSDEVPVDYSARWAFIERNGSDYYDLRKVMRGTDYRGDRVVRIGEAHIFRMSAHRFVRLKSARDVADTKARPIPSLTIDQLAMRNPETIRAKGFSIAAAMRIVCIHEPGMVCTSR